MKLDMRFCNWTKLSSLSELEWEFEEDSTHFLLIENRIPKKQDIEKQ